VLLVGLTGGIASGKSLVRGYFEELGARTIDADQVSRDLVSPGSEAWSRILAAFGPDYLNPDGTLHRRRMAETIFTDSAKRHRLEQILHPLIGNEIAARIQRFGEEDPGAVVVVDAALLVEIGSHEDFDRLVVVYADERTRVNRLMARDHLTRHEAFQRILAQMPLEEKLELADFVIDNTGSPQDTRREAMRVYNHLLSLATGSIPTAQQALEP
jgi:dephospho-CoA kinase